MNLHRSPRGLSVSALAAGLILGGLSSGIISTTTATAGQWSNCSTDPTKLIMFAQVRGMSCTEARSLGKKALNAWNGQSRTITVQGFRCTMRSGSPYNASVGGTCKKGTVAAKFSTGD